MEPSSVFENPYSMFTLFIVISCFVCVSSDPGDISIVAHPSAIHIGKTASLKVDCTPQNAEIVTVFQLAIGTVLPDGSQHELALLSNSKPNTVVIKDASLKPRLTASGSLQKGGSIGIEVSQLRCDDATRYYCKSVHLLGATGTVSQDETNVTVTAFASAGDVDIRLSPKQDDYAIGSVVQLTCSGDLGNDFDPGNLLQAWSWEWRNESSSAWEVYPDPKNISISNATEVSQCSYTGSSSLIHGVIETEDQHPEFRCLFHGKRMNSSLVLIRPKPTPVYATCQEVELMAAVSEAKTVSNDSASTCSSGEHSGPEAVPMEFCDAPSTAFWAEGLSVMENCDVIPLHTPIAMFQFGLYVDNNAAIAGVFMGCSDKGFTMAAQLCGHPVDLYHLDMGMAAVSEAENPMRYHVVKYTSPVTTHRPILVG